MTIFLFKEYVNSTCHKIIQPNTHNLKTFFYYFPKSVIIFIHFAATLCVNFEKTFDKLSLNEFLNVCSCYYSCSLLVKVNRNLRSCVRQIKFQFIPPNKQRLAKLGSNCSPSVLSMPKNKECQKGALRRKDAQ